MKSLKSRLVIAAVALAAVVAASITAIGVKDRAARRIVDAVDVIWPDMPQDTAASDAVLPQTARPVLNVGGRENADVYLQSLDIQVEAAGNIASTRYTMVFKNRTNDILEGELTFPLPDGLSVTHYALDINGKMRDADFLKNAVSDRPIHCAVSSANADYGAMKRIAGKTRGKFLNINTLSLENLRSELLNETPLFLGMEHGSAVREAYPNVATPVHGNFSVAGISDTDYTELTLLFGFGNTVEKRVDVKLNARKANHHGGAYKIWAQKKVSALDLDYEKNRAELAELGRQFGVVTRATSLIVLETVRDYVQYGIEPPATEPILRAEYLNMKRYRIKEWRWGGDVVGAGGTQIGRIAGIKGWHNYSADVFGKGGFHTDIDAVASGAGVTKSGGAAKREPVSGGKGGDADAPAGGLPPENGGTGNGRIAQPTVTVKPFRTDKDYLKKLTGKIADDYQTYLRLRDDYAGSPMFYYDMADWFYTRGDRETALRVLTSIAELNLENAPLYRLLGYRFKEYGEYALEKFVCRKVMQWRPKEPQSYRDYALALADNGEAQEALDSLCSLLARSDWANINQGMEEIITAEINQLIAKNANLNKPEIHTRLPKNLPADIRVVINKSVNNADINVVLRVKDPNNEESFPYLAMLSGARQVEGPWEFGHTPEQFLLENAIKGKYRVYVRYYHTSTDPLFVMAEIYTKYADKAEQRRVVCLPLPKTKANLDYPYAKVEVAEFEF